MLQQTQNNLKLEVYCFCSLYVITIVAEEFFPQNL